MHYSCSMHFSNVQRDRDNKQLTNTESFSVTQKQVISLVSPEIRVWSLETRPLSLETSHGLQESLKQQA